MQDRNLKQSLFLFDDDLTDSMVIRLDRHVSSQLAQEQDLVIRIESKGGKLSLVEKVFDILYFAANDKKSKIITQAVYVRSSSLLVYLNASERQVSASSKAVIHLPVHARGQQCHFAHEEAIKTYAEYVVKKTTLGIESCKALNEMELRSDFLLQEKFATKFIETAFKPYV